MERDHQGAAGSGGEHIAEVHEACRRCDWSAALDLLLAVDGRNQLDPAGLELLADCARWAGRNDQVVDPLERAHRGFVTQDDAQGAARTALGLCHAHADACTTDLAAAWWQRASDLLEGLEESPIHGLHAWFQSRRLAERGDQEGHEREARKALDIARRHGDRNVEALALIEIAHVATVRGRTSVVMDALERATSLAVSGEIGLLESGMVFCSAIWASRSRGEWDRARQWTESANRWVDRTRVSYFPGLCRVHRSEVQRIRGHLAEAEQEAREAARILESSIPRWACLAWAEVGEVCRRRGDLAGARAAFRRAVELGWDPQPGMALLLLSQGDPEAAFRSLERVFRQPTPTLLCEDRINLLQARVTICVAQDELDLAGEAVAELAALAADEPTPWDAAAHAQSEGELLLARGQVKEAVDQLIQARNAWAELGAPYELARCRQHLARALDADQDPAGAAMEREAAAETLDRIGAQSGPGAGPAPGGFAAVRAARLVREGDFWTIQFDGKVMRLKDSRGLHYLARLLAEPDVDHPALVLATDGQSTGATAEAAGDAGEVLDDQARVEYQRRAEELQEDLQEARDHGDEGREERLRAEMEVLAQHLAGAVGLGGRSRRMGGGAERARQSVTKAVRGLIKRIQEEHASLGRHLESTVRTGQVCSYRPDPDRPIAWTVSRTAP